jgi:hypothetical protein
MKKLILSIILTAIIQSIVLSQGCLPEGITFLTQEEIDNFQTNYPGCTEIEGNVIITGIVSDIVNLDGLEVLTNIGGYLKIINNTLLTSLTGLDNLNSIGGLQISNNVDLISLSSLENVTSIQGDLSIGDVTYGGNPSLTNLMGLHNIEVIEGNLVIFQNNTLSDFFGNSNLISIEGNLQIYGNHILTSLIGFNNLNYIGGFMEIIDNIALINLAGLEALNTIGDYCRIRNNDNLTDLTGLNSLSFVGGGLVIETNYDLLNLTGLESLISIGGSLEVLYNGDLQYLTGLENLAMIDEHLVIIGNSNLLSISSLSNLTYISGQISLKNNHSLQSLSGIDNIYPQNITFLRLQNNLSLSNCECESVCTYLSGPNGSATITDNAFGCHNQSAVETACEALHCLPDGILFTTQEQIDSFQINHPYCTEIEGSISIIGNEISNIYTLYNLTSIGGDLEIIDAINLVNLNGLNNLNSIGEDFIIYNTNGLVSFNGVSDLQTIGGSFLIEDNNNIYNFEGLESLIQVYGELKISTNNSLTDLNGLNSLISIGENLTLSNNVQLNNIEALSNLVTVGGNLIIENSNLTSLFGIENIQPSSITNLSIYNNPYLISCDVQSICEYLVSTNWTIEIHNNAAGCNSPEEVVEACITGVQELSNENTFIYSPNPMESTTLIQYILHYNSPVTLEIFDLRGQSIVTLVDELQQQGEQKVVFNGIELQPGIYFCTFKTNEGMQTIKMIKL